MILHSPAPDQLLTLILGPLIEENFMQSIIKADGVLTTFVERPIAAVVAAICGLVWSSVVVMSVTRIRNTSAGKTAWQEQ